MKLRPDLRPDLRARIRALPYADEAELAPGLLAQAGLDPVLRALQGAAALLGVDHPADVASDVAPHAVDVVGASVDHGERVGQDWPCTQARDHPFFAVDPVAQCVRAASAHLGDAREFGGDVGDDALGRVRRGGGADVGDEVEERIVGFVSDRADDRRRRHVAGGRAQHGRGLCLDQLEDGVPDGLPDPAGLGDGQ